MSARACSTALAYLALCFAAAQAIASGPITNEPSIQTSLQKAAAYWGQSIAVEVIYDDFRASAAVAACGSAELDRKRIYLGACYDSRSGVEQCHIIVHEYGHALGYGHDYVGDPSQVMTVGVWNVPDICRDHAGEAMYNASVVNAARIAQLWVDYQAASDAAAIRRYDRSDCMSSAWDRKIRKARERKRTQCRRRLPKLPMPAPPKETLP